MRVSRASLPLKGWLVLGRESLHPGSPLYPGGRLLRCMRAVLLKVAQQLSILPDATVCLESITHSPAVGSFRVAASLRPTEATTSLTIGRSSFWGAH